MRSASALGVCTADLIAVDELDDVVIDVSDTPEGRRLVDALLAAIATAGA